MNNWLAGMLDALFGTFHRTRNTVIGIFVLLMIFVPPFRYAVLMQLQSLALAAMGPLLLIGIMVYAFRRMTGFTGGRRRH